MSNYAQEWVWRYSNARGIAKYVFLAIARRIFRNGATETPPTSLKNLTEVTGLSLGTVRRSIHELESKHGEIDVLKGNRKGTVHRFRLRRELKLPLMAADAPADCQRSERSLSVIRAITEPVIEGITDSDPGDHCQCPERSLPVIPVITDAPPVSSLDLNTKKDLTTTAATTTAAVAAAFLTWVRATYPVHNAGAQITIHNEPDMRLVATLLDGPPARALDRLQAMAIVMWTITRHEDAYLSARRDRGVRLLLHAADRFELVAIARAAVAPPVLALSLRETREAELARIIVRLETLTSGALGLASRSVLATLRSESAPDLARLDAQLFAAACLDVDVAGCEADARLSLAGFEQRMPTVQFAAAVAAARGRNIRTRANLPDLFVLERRREARG